MKPVSRSSRSRHWSGTRHGSYGTKPGGVPPPHGGRFLSTQEEQLPMTMAPPAIDLDRLLKLRLVVGRYGEMDVARWWNTKGMLGKHGASVLQRGFPTTH